MSAAADDRPDDEETAQLEDKEDELSPDKTDADGAKRFERSDNLRRRSEWFQKRTGGR